MNRRGKEAINGEDFTETYVMDTLSITSSADERLRMKKLIDDILQSRSSRQYFKMLSYQLIPLIALVIVCSILLSQLAMVHSNAHLLHKVALDNDRIGELVIALQVERGLTTAYISSNYSQTDVYTELVTARRDTDKAFGMIEDWPEALEDDAMWPLNDQKNAVKVIQQHRQKVDSRHKELSGESCSEKNLMFYTDINRRLIETNIEESRRLEAKVWHQLVAKQSILLATDFYGIERALGSVFYVQCSLRDDNMHWLRTVRTQGDMMLNQTFDYHHRSRTEYSRLLKTVDNANTHVESMRSEILSKSNSCNRNTLIQGEAKSLAWFRNSTQLINLLISVRGKISQEISQYVEDIQDNAFRMIILYSLLGTMTISACLILSICHARKSHTLLSSISYYAKDLSEKKTELASEKKLTLRLVYQSIPVGIARQLQAGKSVEAMVFEAVTIYFSKIEGFPNFAARSTPIQVVNLLNRFCR